MRTYHSGDPLEQKSKVIRKLYCDKLCEVAVLKELVDGTLEKDFTKATHASVWSLFFIKKSIKDFSSIFY